jgi:hypothetical protein
VSEFLRSVTEIDNGLVQIDLALNGRNASPP